MSASECVGAVRASVRQWLSECEAKQLLSPKAARKLRRQGHARKLHHPNRTTNNHKGCMQCAESDSALCFCRSHFCRELEGFKLLHPRALLNCTLQPVQSSAFTPQQLSGAFSICSHRFCCFCVPYSLGLHSKQEKCGHLTPFNLPTLQHYPSTPLIAHSIERLRLG